jgi:hypothetical protein
VLQQQHNHALLQQLLPLLLVLVLVLLLVLSPV